MKTYLCDNCGELIPKRLEHLGHKNHNHVNIGRDNEQVMKIAWEINKDLCHTCVDTVIGGFFRDRADELKEAYEEATIAMKIKSLASIPME